MEHPAHTAARAATACRVPSAATCSTRPGLGIEESRPPWKRGYGTYCLRAACNVWGEGGQLVGRVVGYDRYLHIQDAVENACRIQAQGMPGVACGSVRLTLLSEHRKECAGQVYFVMDGTARRVFHYDGGGS